MVLSHIVTIYDGKLYKDPDVEDLYHQVYKGDYPQRDLIKIHDKEKDLVPDDPHDIIDHGKIINNFNYEDSNHNNLQNILKNVLHVKNPPSDTMTKLVLRYENIQKDCDQTNDKDSCHYNEKEKDEDELNITLSDEEYRLEIQNNGLNNYSWASRQKIEDSEIIKCKVFLRDLNTELKIILYSEFDVSFKEIITLIPESKTLKQSVSKENEDHSWTPGELIEEIQNESIQNRVWITLQMKMEKGLLKISFNDQKGSELSLISSLLPVGPYYITFTGKGLFKIKEFQIIHKT